MGAPIDTGLSTITKSRIKRQFGEVGALTGAEIAYDGTKSMNDEVSLKVDKVTGKSLVLDTEITKLGTVSAGAKLASVVAGTNVTVDNTDPANPIISSSGGGGDYYTSLTTTITSAEVLALFTTPKELVPAPASGSYIVVDRVIVSMTYNSVAYATNDGLVIRYTDGSGAEICGHSSAFSHDGINSFLAATANAEAMLPSTNKITESAPVVAAVNTGNPTAGNSDIKITVVYQVLVR